MDNFNKQMKMMEWKRVYQEKLLLLFIGLLLLNSALYLRDQSKPVELPEEETTVVDGVEAAAYEDDGETCTTDEAYRAYGILLRLSEQMGIENTQEYYSVYNELSEAAQTLGAGGRFAMSHLKEQLYSRDIYQGVMENILISAGKQSNISIFNRDQSFSVANRERTVQDFSKTRAVYWRITQTYAVESVLSQKSTIYLLLLFMIAVVWQFGTERKLGLWGMIYQTVGGRGQLAGKRSVLLAGTAVVSTLLMYGALFLYAFWRYGGWNSLMQPMQCLKDFYRIPYLLTVWQVILLQMAVTAMGLFLFAMLLWLCLTVCMNRTVAVLLFGVILGSEYLSYIFIGMKSMLALLYHMNLFQLIFPYRWMTIYFNWGIGRLVVSRFVLILVFAVVSAVVLTGTQILLNQCIRPVHAAGILERRIHRCEEGINHLTGGLPVFVQELHKLLIRQKIFLFLLLVLYMTVETKKVSGVSYDAIDGNYQKEFYESCGGMVDEYTIQWVEKLQNRLNDYEEQKKQTESDYQEGKITFSEYSSKISMIDDTQRKDQKLYTLADEQIKYLQMLQEEKGISGWILDERGYESFLGKRNYQNQLTLGLFSVFAVLMAGAVLISQEEQAGMKQLLNSTFGRERLRIKKYAVITLMTAVVWCCSYGYNLWNMINVYHLTDFAAPVQSIRMLGEFPLSLSVGGFIVWLYGMRFLLLLMLAFMAAFVSGHFGYYPSILISLLFLLPHIFYLLGVTAAGDFSVVFSLAFLQHWNEYGSSLIMWIHYGVIILLGILSLLPYEKVGKIRSIHNTSKEGERGRDTAPCKENGRRG